MANCSIDRKVRGWPPFPWFEESTAEVHGAQEDHFRSSAATGGEWLLWPFELPFSSIGVNGRAAPAKAPANG